MERGRERGRKEKNQERKRKERQWLRHSVGYYPIKPWAARVVEDLHPEQWLPNVLSSYSHNMENNKRIYILDIIIIISFS